MLKKFKEKYEIFDIIIYGSLVKGKTNVEDIDITIILIKKTKLADKLRISQELKHSLSKHLNYKLDVNALDIGDFLDKNFLARQAILAEGYSIFKKKKLCELFGFKNAYIFSYSLRGLSHSKKIMFQYALKGRRGEKGLLRLKNCEVLGRGVIKVPPEHSEEFKEFLEKNKVKHKVYHCLFY